MKRAVEDSLVFLRIPIYQILIHYHSSLLVVGVAVEMPYQTLEAQVDLVDFFNYYLIH